ncbi:FAD-dependent monooxygenase sdcF-like protein [Cladobotryum mycophilum]|uniref:FAD-dependent monooxygenase sdcF-like protein n=1 Tax=Cladobotryum mycophilum TaxID=491253 RepID=A0ABR0S7X7_9HYPO
MKSGISIASAIAFAASANGTPADTNANCCNALAKAVPGIYYAAFSSQYNTLINVRWSGTAVLHPGCIVTPKSADDVSKVIKIIVPNQCQFAVKSGGHNANPGANSINGGVSIDLSGLNAPYLAQDRSYVSLGTGTTWGQAYDAFNSSNIGFTGGICEDVGAGGVAIGGGQSLFQPKRGWAIDNILNYQVVLASGQIVNANKTSNPDLYKALKGGNTNLGIVTRINIAAFDFDGLWGGEVFVSLQGPQATRQECIDQLSQATVNFTANNHLDVDTAVQLMTVYLSGNKGQIVNAAFGNTKVKNTAGHVKLADFVHDVSQFQAKGYRQVTASITIFNDVTTLREIWNQTDAIYDALPQKDKVDWMVSFIPQPKVQQSYAAANGGNSLGLANIDKDQIVIWLTSRWTDPSLDGMMTTARDKFVDVTTAVSKKHNTYHPFLYINYATPKQDPLCGYGAESAAFIKKTAKKYDPSGVFQTLMPGGFKISKVTCA